MKIDSSILDIDIKPERKLQSGIVISKQIEFDIWENETIQFFADCPTLNMKDLEEIIRIAKLFKDRRIAFLEKQKKLL